MYSNDLLDGIIRFLPLTRAKDLLYMNGEIDPSLCTLEIEMYKQSIQKPGIYIGYHKSGQPTIETYSDAKEADKRVVELRGTIEKDESLKVVIIHGKEKR